MNAVGSVPVYFPYRARDQLSGLKPILVARLLPPRRRRPRSRTCARAHLEYYIDGKWVRTPARRPTSTASPASRTSSRSSGASRSNATLDDPMIAPDLADKVIPNLTADTGFDRGRVQPARAGVHRAVRGRAAARRSRPCRGSGATRPARSSSVKQPEADAVLAVLRGQAPIPTTHDRAAPTRAGSGTTARRPACAVPTSGCRVLNGSGVQGAAGQHLAGAHGRRAS